jgi:hypothetical protein
MEEIKVIDKRTKEYRDLKQADKSPVEHLFEGGIPLSKVELQSAVNNTAGTPENMYSESSQNPQRKAEIRLCASGNLIIFKQKDGYFATHGANGRYFHFK